MKKIILISLILFNFYSCKEDFDIINLSNNKVFVVGHGGSGFVSITNNISENSMKSLEIAIEGYNADGIEVDIQLTQDSQLVMYHDDFLRTKTSCFGRINDHKWSEINDCRYKKKYFGSVFVDETLALLDLPMEKFSKRNIIPQFHLDLRYNNFDSAKISREEYYGIFARQIVRIVEKYNAEEWIYCGTGDFKLMQAIHSLNSNIKLLYEGPSIEEMIKSKKEMDYFGIVVSNNNISKEGVKIAHDNNLRVAIFSLRGLAENKDGLKKSPDFLITDNITLLQDILN